MGATPAIPVTAAARLAQLGIELGAAPALGGRYVPWTRAGDVLFLAGVASPSVKGRLGDTVDVALGRQAAEGCVRHLLAVLVDALGSLDGVAQVLKMTGFVACTPEFTDVPAVVDGASELLLGVFGEGGRHARSAIGVSALPGGAAVEVELTVRVMEGWDGTDGAGRESDDRR